MSPGLAATIGAIIPTDLVVLEIGKHVFYGRLAAAPAPAPRRPRHHRVLRRAARWTVHGRPHPLR